MASQSTSSVASRASSNGTVTASLPVPGFVAVLHWMFIRPEERVMEGAFGDEYVAYKRRVRRWL